MSICALTGTRAGVKILWSGLMLLLVLSTRSEAQDWPDPNPVRQSDGSLLYWCGNNMQWDIQEAIDAAVPGDTVVIRGGDYVDSLTVNTPNLTIRPFVDSSGRWEAVTLWNPTKGPQAENGWALKIGSNSDNTYIGRPRQYRQLENGFVSLTMVVPGEYLADSGEPAMTVADVTGDCFLFRSRSIDCTGVLSEDGKATVENCVFTSGSGFGGGVVLYGTANTTAFVDCEFHGLFASGVSLRTDVAGLDVPNYAISILGGVGVMNPTFSACVVRDNIGESIIYQTGGTGSWTGGVVRDNQSETNFAGAITILGGVPAFSRVRFDSNVSGYGTVFFNGLGASDLVPLRFEHCEFIDNTTIDGQYGGVLYAIDESGEGTPPKVMFDGCRIDRNNGYPGFSQEDIVTTYSPNYRQGRRNASVFDEELGCQKSGDLDGNGVVDGADLGILFTIWGTTGQIP